MQEKSTTYLMGILKDVKKESLARYVDEHLEGHSLDFPTYMDYFILSKKMKRQDIFQRADLPQKYGYKLLRGESRTTDRDKLLRIFLAMEMSLKEVQRALELYGLPILYPKKPRDAIFIIAFNQGVTSVDTVNEWLEEHREAALTEVI